MTTRTGVTCPNCGTEYVADLCDGDGDLVSYWGEGDPVIVNCGKCDAEMKIREVVTRTWEYVPCGDEPVRGLERYIVRPPRAPRTGSEQDDEDTYRRRVERERIGRRPERGGKT